MTENEYDALMSYLRETQQAFNQVKEYIRSSVESEQSILVLNSSKTFNKTNESYDYIIIVTE